jgi:hypothetical protein
MYVVGGSQDDWIMGTNGNPARGMTAGKTHDNSPHYYVVCSDGTNRGAYQDGSAVDPAGTDSDDIIARYFWTMTGTSNYSQYIIGAIGYWDENLCDAGYVTGTDGLNEQLADLSGI